MTSAPPQSILSLLTKSRSPTFELARVTAHSLPDIARATSTPDAKAERDAHAQITTLRAELIAADARTLAIAALSKILTDFTKQPAPSQDDPEFQPPISSETARKAATLIIRITNPGFNAEPSASTQNPTPADRDRVPCLDSPKADKACSHTSISPHLTRTSPKRPTPINGRSAPTPKYDPLLSVCHAQRVPGSCVPSATNFPTPSKKTVFLAQQVPESRRPSASPTPAAITAQPP